MLKILYITMLVIVASAANAQKIDVIAEYSVETALDVRNTFDTSDAKQFPVRTNPFSGVLPYTAKLGIETTSGSLTYGGGYVLKKDNDVFNGYTYDYEGLYLELKYKHCIYACNR